MTTGRTLCLLDCEVENSGNYLPRCTNYQCLPCPFDDMASYPVVLSFGRPSSLCKREVEKCREHGVVRMHHNVFALFLAFIVAVLLVCSFPACAHFFHIGECKAMASMCRRVGSLDWNLPSKAGGLGSVFLSYFSLGGTESDL